MCRAEAHQLYSRKTIFDALGFQLVAVLHEQIESEVISLTLVYAFLSCFLHGNEKGHLQT